MLTVVGLFPCFRFCLVAVLFAFVSASHKAKYATTVRVSERGKRSKEYTGPNMLMLSLIYSNRAGTQPLAHSLRARSFQARSLAHCRRD